MSETPPDIPSDTPSEPSRREARRRELLSKLPKAAVAAEIGVWEGRFSEVILEVAAPRELHLIDPWTYQPEFSNTGFGRKKFATRMDEMFNEVSQRFAAVPAVHLHRAMSGDALAGFPDGYFDWVYVDGNHNSPVIDEDLALSAVKVRAGGMIAGDDYNWQAEAGAPVKTAVQVLMARLGPKARFRVFGNQYLIRLPE